MTRRRRFAGVLAVLALAAAAWAELEVAEKRFVRECVAALPGAASKRAQDGIAAALTPFGTEAIATAVLAVDALKTERDWASLERALRAGDGARAADAIEAVKAKWPPAHAERLANLVVVLRGQPPVTVPPATDGELDPAEKRWVRECFEAVAGKTPRLRLAGERGLAPFGAAAAPVALTVLDLMKTDEQWAALERALDQCGARRTADVLDAAKSRWPKPHAARLEKLVANLRTLSEGDEVDPAADARIREIVAAVRAQDRASPRSDEAAEIARFGRKAVPTLLAVLAEEDDRSRAASLALWTLTDLVRERDVPRLRKLLRDGVTSAASLLDALRCPEATDALLDAFDAGVLDRSVAEALFARRDDARIGPAVVRWITTHTTAGDEAVASAARLCGKLRLRDAVPRLLEILDTAQDSDVVFETSNALTSLGRKEGIEGLVRLLENASGGSASLGSRHEAGRRLNNLSRSFAYKGTYDGPDGESRIGAAADAAASEFRTWWDGVKDRARWDETQSQWIF